MQHSALVNLTKAFSAGSIPALARLLTIIENEPEACEKIFGLLKPFDYQPIVIGITGAPGSGKSTLINQLLRIFEREFSMVAVLTFDPSSERSGGAFLGDRERMMEHAAEENVFIRSFANRGKLGGMSSEIYDFLLLLSAFKFDIVLIETIGVGQTEIDIAHAADLSVVVLTPYFGDDMQILKAGVLEVADLFVINKSDLPGAGSLSNRLQEFVQGASGRKIPTVFTQANNGSGIEELARHLLAIHGELAKTGLLMNRRRAKYQQHMQYIIHRQIVAKIFGQSGQGIPSKMGDSFNPYEFSDEIHIFMKKAHD